MDERMLEARKTIGSALRTQVAIERMRETDPALASYCEEVADAFAPLPPPVPEPPKTIEAPVAQPALTIRARRVEDQDLVRIVAEICQNVRAAGFTSTLAERLFALAIEAEAVEQFQKELVL